MTIPVRVELVAETDKATKKVQDAAKKMKGSLDATAASGKKFTDGLNKGLDDGQKNAITFMASMAKVTAVIGLSKVALNWGDEFAASGKATEEQVVAWGRMKGAIDAAHDALGLLAVTAGRFVTLGLTDAIVDFERKQQEIIDAGAERYEVGETERRKRLDTDEEWRKRADKKAFDDAQAADAYRLAKREEDKRYEDAAAAYAQKQHEAWKRRMAEVTKFRAQMADAANDPSLKNVNINAILSGEPTGNLGGIISDYEGEERRKGEAGEAELAGQAAMIESTQAGMRAAAEFMAMDRKAKVEHAKLMAKQEGFEALTDLAGAATAFALGNPQAIGLLKSAAMHAATAAAWGGGAALMGSMGGGGGTATTGAGGGYARPSSSSSGGPVTNIYNINGYVGQPHELAEELDKRTKSATRAGVIGAKSRVVFS